MPENEFNVIVNGRPKKVPGPSISFEQVVALAFNPVPPERLVYGYVEPW